MTLHTGFLVMAAALGMSASTARAAETCAVYNQQSHTSAERLASELAIANGPLRASDLAAGRNPKLAAYIAQFADNVRVHGLQGRPEPATLSDVKAHYQLVMGSPSSPSRDAEGGLREDLAVVAGPMAAHRYHAALHVPGFPPDFAYYDSAIPLKLRGQTVFDYGGPDGTIRERWSNHDNKFRTGQLWRYMLRHPSAPDPALFRADLLPDSHAPGGLIDRDGDRLNAVFNGELALHPGDFALADGAFRYGPAKPPEGGRTPVTEEEGLRFVQRWFGDGKFGTRSAAIQGWLADDATLHGAGCDQPDAAGMRADVGGPGQRREAAATLQRLLEDHLGPDIDSALLQPVGENTPYAALPISAWSMVAFTMRLERSITRSAANTRDKQPIRLCANVIMRLRKEAASDGTPGAEEVWLSLRPVDDSEISCPPVRGGV